MIRVYKYGLLAPTENADLAHAQLRAAHEYRNDLTAIERGRRSAMRQILDASEEVSAAIDRLKQATKSERREALEALKQVRAKAFADREEECKRIKALDESIRRDARALTSAFWGTYLGVEAAADQSRRAPLYEDDGITPREPRFLRSGHLDAGAWSLPDEGSLGVQIQAAKPLTSEGLYAAEDTRARIMIRDRRKSGDYGELRLRISSDGREPIWASWPIKMHRPLPPGATITWVRVTCRHKMLRAVWSCEITVDIPEPKGAIAVDLCWEDVGDDRLRVARWRDDAGRSGEVILPPGIRARLRKASDLRSLRDRIRNELLIQDEETGRGGILPRTMRAEGLHLRDDWLGEAARTIHLWRSTERLHRLRARWLMEQPTVGPQSLAVLDAWAKGTGAKHDHGDRHLWRYETGVRHNALGERREIYRLLARQWKKRYEWIIFDGADLRRAARFGADSDLRFAAAPSELGKECEKLFGERVSVCLRDPKDEREWCVRAIEEWRKAHDGDGSNGHAKKGGAWSRRKAAKAAKAEAAAQREAARKAEGDAA